MSEVQTVEIPVQGMDCAECTQHVRHAIASLPGVQHVEVYLASERATVALDPAQVSLDAIRKAVADAGYRVPEAAEAGPVESAAGERAFARRIGILPPILAAAAQSIPDLGILGNSARLLKQR
jgi:P-type Cu+ transporter